MNVNPTSEFPVELARVTKHWRAALDQRLAKIGLSQARMQVLGYVQQFPMLAQQHVARGLGIEGSTLVALLQQLEKDGLVERRANANDSRARHAFLSAAGKLRYEQAEAIYLEYYQLAMVGVSQREIECLNKTYQKLLMHLNMPSEFTSKINATR
ncbi:MarR family winged helix-turn-helix transcriptional regulator [Pseudomonas sp. NPDC089392]|uniref:MarR family winged helix-turn-helix transcriptional regulator n=1 Tax=Pseudomonas sp. NPDC089392 TaxID=3364459 RepID=UPI00381471EF